MEIAEKELFKKLAEGHAAGVTVVTPNARLARALQRSFDEYQVKDKRVSWEAADILPFDSFVLRLHDDAQHEAGRDAALPLPVLSPAQELALWREEVSRAGLLVPGAAAAQCRDAWAISHQWRIAPGRSSEDAQAFAAWAAGYRRRTEGLADLARLPDIVAACLPRVRKPSLLVAYAFDILTPQRQAFLDACAAAGVELARCAPPARRGACVRVSFASRKDELERAAAWARARLEAAGTGAAPSIGVVVPDLAQRRKEVVRVFSRVFDPGYNLPGAKRGRPAFNVSLGLPLAEYPLVAAALALLRFSRESLAFEEVSRLVRSPFLAGAEKDAPARAALDVRLRRALPATVTLAALLAQLDRRSLLRERLEQVYGLRDDGLFADKAPSEWARHFSALLQTAGFPGERGLDSTEHQTLAKWHEALGELARLDRVARVLPFGEALGALHGLCADTLFQPEGGDAPVQVLGILESAGLAFDHLWVSGLTDEAWPLDAAPHPFLPVAAQKAAGLPEASAEGSLELDRRITDGWRRAADEVVLSSFEREEDRQLSPSPLIADLPAGALQVPAPPRLRDLVHARRAAETIDDARAPALREKAVKGGTRVLTDQAACPFRAYARWRLRAERLESPVDGLDAGDRGTLLHAFMAFLWKELKGSEALGKDVGSAIEAAAAFAVKEVGIEGRFAELERERLARLAAEWLEVERARPPFEVLAAEKTFAFRLGGLEFTGRIDRLDRIEGGHALIDYKTSRQPSPKQWEPPRPDDAQLPVYAVTSEVPVAAVAFAKIRPGEMRYMGFSRDKDALPQVRPAKNWGALLEDWRREGEALAGGFAAGEARVDPKRELATCRYCDLQTLCRVYEKFNPLKEEEQENE